MCANPTGTAATARVRYVDCGDGTLVDTNTGLMWEKKDSACAAGDLHCVETPYTWSASSTAADGTLYTQFLAALNSDASADGVSTCFANHCDWRIPNIEELKSILLAPYPCSTSPCIDPAFGPTLASFYYYWSSTSSSANPLLAWYVSFFLGGVGNDFKNPPPGTSYARAVRGGL